MDGVLSANVIPMSTEGEPLRTVNIKDGLTVADPWLPTVQSLAIITGGRTEAVRKRFLALGLLPENIYMGSSVKIHDIIHIFGMDGLTKSLDQALYSDIQVHAAPLGLPAASCTLAAKSLQGHLPAAADGRDGYRQFPEVTLMDQWLCL